MKTPNTTRDIPPAERMIVFRERAYLFWVPAANSASASAQAHAILHADRRAESHLQESATG